MGTHKFRFSAIMPHSWLYKLKGISRSSRKRLPYTSPPLMLLPQESSVKLFFFLHLFITLKPSSRLKLSSSSLNSHVTLTTYRNHRSVLTSANAIILDPPLNSHVSLTSSWNHRSKSTVGSSSKPVSSSPSDQNYGFSREPESKSVDIKALNRVDSEDPSISDNSSPVLVETVNKKTCDTRTQQKLKKPKAGSSGIRIRANSPKIARRKTKGRTSYTSKRKGNS
uniref:DNA-binding domain-containing protein n=2 Tax=Brassica oleracea TaxID=3712 RepID=A0A0D3AL88_BRAOL